MLECLRLNKLPSSIAMYTMGNEKIKIKKYYDMIWKNVPRSCVKDVKIADAIDQSCIWLRII